MKRNHLGRLAAATFVGTAALALRQLFVLSRVKRQAVVDDVSPFERRGGAYERRVLMVGDSTGVGVGVEMPELSLAGLFAEEFGAVEIVNRCRFGARVRDVLEQIDDLGTGPRFDLAVILVGSNDVLHSTREGRLHREVDRLLERICKLADRVVWMGCADIGAAPAILPPFAWWLSWRTRRTMRLLAAWARQHDVDFIDFASGEHGRKIRQRPKVFFAADGVHPSASAYGYCIEVLGQRPAVQTLRDLRHADGQTAASPARPETGAPPEAVPVPRN